nr:hypothetical protein [Candidatus Njordarchaeota archaeon]
MSSRKYVTSFEVNTSGELVPTELSTRTTDPKKVVLIIDEASRKIYLWLGSESSKNNRMVARRAANSIPIFGLKVKGLDFPVGKDCKITEVDESLKDSDKLASSNLVQLEDLLKRPYTKLADGIWHIKELPVPQKEEKLKPEARTLERRMQYEMSHLEKETVEKDKKRRAEERGK